MELKDQLLLEDDLILQGVDRYTGSTESAQTQGRGSDTGYGQRLLTTLVRPVAEEIHDFCTSGVRKHGKWRTLIKSMDSETVAYIGIKTVLNSLHLSPTLSMVCSQIGNHLEDEQRFSAFKEMNPEYYAVVMKDLNRKNTKAYRHMRNVLAVTSKKKGLNWNSWDKETKLGVGAAVLDQLLKSTDLVKVSKTKLKMGKFVSRVVATPEAVEWIESYNEYASLLHPYTKPCIIPPDEWSGLNNGGYWSEAMRQRTPLIKGLSGSEQKFVEEHDLSVVYNAVNSVQKTPWMVNKPVLKVLQEVWTRNLDIGLPKKEPIEIPKFRTETAPKDMDTETFEEFLKWKAQVSQMYTDEISRASRAYEVARTIQMAHNYAQYDGIWFVYQCDFRGRMYASSSGLNPQGSDFNRSLLRFRDGKVLGQNGLYWLAVHGANCFGVDKVSFDDRVEWVMENIEKIQATKQEPLEHTDFWGEADYPFMFLAFCMEFAEAVYDPDNFISHLPVGMDGSCNGLQNFSAMLRDEVGGEATNLLPSDTPADIYQEVADLVLKKIQDSEHSDCRTEWLAFADKHGGISRKIAKRPVMTLPYGSTKYSCFGFVCDAVRDIDENFFKENNVACSYLTDLLWESIGEIVVSSREAMAWLQSIAKLTASQNLPVWWVNPAGFPVHQAIKKQKSTQVRTSLMGGLRLRLNKVSNQLNTEKQVQGIAPNFVHSMDSAHMMLTTVKAVEHGINCFSMIHDDFGTHAADVENFRTIIREAFVCMYKDNDPLGDLYLSVAMTNPDGKVPPVPDSGELDINKVLEAEYFFA
jgi:DNA-directed RNA polymerase